jgi:hypothetical protein
MILSTPGSAIYRCEHCNERVAVGRGVIPILAETRMVIICLKCFVTFGAHEMDRFADARFRNFPNNPEREQ